MTTFIRRRAGLLIISGVTLVIVLAGIIIYRNFPEFFTNPQVVAIQPEGGARQPLSAPITLAFNQHMDHSSVESAVKLEPPAPVSYRWQDKGTGETLTLIPTQNLEFDKSYQVVLDTSARNLRGRSLSQQVSSTFQTNAQTEVTQVQPAQDSSQVGLSQPVSIFFDHKLVTVTDLDQQVGLPQPVKIEPALQGTGRWLSESRFAFYPETGWQPGTTYTVVISREVSPGAELAKDYSWQFTTEKANVAASIPFNGQIEVARNTPVTIIFNHVLAQKTVESDFVLHKANSDTPIPGDFSWGQDRVTFKPSQPLDRATAYVVEVKGATAAYKADFRTVEALKVAMIIPADGAKDIAAVVTDTLITVQFNHPVVPLVSVDDKSKPLTILSTQPLTIAPSVIGEGKWLNTSTYTFRPGETLLPATTYKVTVNKGLADVTGSSLEEDYSWSFTTVGPRLVRATPQDKATLAGPTQPVTMTFNIPMDHPSAQAAFHLRRVSDGAEVPGDVRWDTLRMGFFPSANLTRGAVYEASLVAGAKGVGGRGSLAPSSWRFTVAPAPRITTTQPANGGVVPVGNSVFLNFAAPMDPGTIGQYVSIDPKPTNVFSYLVESDTRLILSWQMQPSTKYTLRFSGQAHDRYGTPTGQDFVLIFTTLPRDPSVYVTPAGRVSVVNAGEAVPSLFLGAVNITQANLALYKMNRANFINLTGSNSFKAWDEFNPNQADLLRTWSVPVAGAFNENLFITTTLTVDNAPLPEGLYLLQANGAPRTGVTGKITPDRRLLVVTRINLTLKKSASQVLVWATDFTQGRPLTGANLTLTDENGQTLAQGTTDSQGVWLQKYPQQPEIWRPIYLFSENPFGVSVSQWNQGINPYEFSLRGGEVPQRYYGNIYTERPIYRPGQIVYFKGIFRQDGETTLALPDFSAVTLTARDPQGKQILTGTLKLDEFGAFNGSLPLDQQAPLGNYYIELRLVGSSAQTSGKGDPYQQFFGQSFQVAAYRKPEFQVNVSTDKQEYVQGDKINVEVQADYFFGGAVSGASVQWRVLRNDYTFQWNAPGVPGNWSFIDDDALRSQSDASGAAPRRTQFASEGKGTTDGQGYFQVQIPADVSDVSLSKNFVIDVELTDPNSQVVAGRNTVVVHKADLYLGLQPVLYVATVGKAAAVRLVSVNSQGITAPNQTVDVQVLQRQWFSVQERNSDGIFRWTSKFTDTLETSLQVKTDVSGFATLTFTPKNGGLYRVVATGQDGRGNTARSATSVWVSSSKYVSWERQNNDRITLVPDKKLYLPGETARILVPAPYSDIDALLVIEQGQVRRYQLIHLKANSDLLEIPIASDDVPNVYVSLVMVKGQVVEGTQRGEDPPDFKLGYTELKVSTREKEIKLSLSPDRTSAKYGPRDPVTYTITAADFQGHPVQAQISFAVVDKAVLSLSSQRGQSLLETFYGERPLGVSTSATMLQLSDRNKLALAAPGGKGGGGAEGGDLLVRSVFKDVAFWQADITTDANGRATVSFELPDNLTTWVIIAKAITKSSLVGEAIDEIVTTKDLLIRPAFPRFLVVGDHVQLQAAINNNTASDVTVNVKLEAAGLTLQPAPQGAAVQASQSVKVPARGQVKLLWPALVNSVLPANSNQSALPNEQTVLKVTAIGESAGQSLSDVIQLTVPIFHYSAPQVVATSGIAGQSTTEEIRLPDKLDREQGNLTVHLNPSLAATTLDALKALQAFPYDSTEQVVSKFLPNVVTLRAMRNLKLNRPDLETRLDQDITLHIQRLNAMQHADGGWGWWLTDQTSPWITAYATFALNEARRAGFAVDDTVYSRALSYLKSYLSRNSTALQPEQLDLRAYILYVLAETGQGDTGLTVALYERREALSTFSRAYLAMALQKAAPEGQERLSAITSDLAGRAVLSATGTHWQDDPARPWQKIYMSTDTRTTALTLQALVRIDSQNLLIPGAVRWLMSQRRYGEWSTTQESATSILAFTDFMLSTGELQGNYNYSVSLNGKEVLTGKVDVGNITQSRQLAVPVKDLVVDQANKLVLQRAGQGRLYYAAYLKYFLPADEVKAQNEGIVVSREYRKVNQTTLASTGEVITAIPVGEVVEVHLTVVAPNDLHYVIVEDPLPAGMEALDTSLKTTSSAVQGPTVQRTDRPQPYWYYWVNAQLRDEKVVLFSTFLPRGSYEYTYQTRASVAGEFNVIPLRASEMYFPEVFGSSAGTKFTIQP
ncbi:MAG: hypothetical protein EXR62_00120 [Chloroflexi bacterium]|nr:hypothetical protein [Chloroflexota bacterium]